MIEAKYAHVSNMLKQAIWLNQQADTFRPIIPNSGPTLSSDSQGTICLEKNLIHHLTP